MLSFLFSDILSEFIKFPPPENVIVKAPISKSSPVYESDLSSEISIIESVKWIIFEDTLNIVSSSQLSIVMSGTASLEVAYLNIPHMVVYKTSKLSYYIAKLLVNIKYFSLTNLILNKKVVNEFIQDDFNTENLISEIKRLNRSEVISELENDYLKIKKTIGLKNSSKEVTEYLLKSL